MKYLVEKFNAEKRESTFGVYRASAVDVYDDGSYFDDDIKPEKEFAEKFDAQDSIFEDYRFYQQGRFIPARFVDDLREYMTHSYNRIKEFGGRIASDSFYRAGGETYGKEFHRARIDFTDGTDGNKKIEARIEFH